MIAVTKNYGPPPKSCYNFYKSRIEFGICKNGENRHVPTQLTVEGYLVYGGEERQNRSQATILPWHLTRLIQGLENHA